jgi:hypothetical protein
MLRLRTFAGCTTCTDAVARTAVMVSPLFRCPVCSKARSVAVGGGAARLGATLAALRRDLRHETALWHAAGGTALATGHSSAAAVCVAQVLVLASREAPTPHMRYCSVGFALGAFRNANALAQRGLASAEGLLTAEHLSNIVVSWAGVLPLLLADPHKVVALLEAAAEQVWQQREAVGVDLALKHVMGALASVYQGLVGVFGDDDPAAVAAATHAHDPKTRHSSLRRILEWQREEQGAARGNAAALAVLRVEQTVAMQESACAESELAGDDSDVREEGQKGEEEEEEEGVFPLLRLHRDPLSVVLGMLSPQRVLWGIGLANRRLSLACRDPLMWRLLFKARWPNVQCIGHLDTDPHNWLRLYINRRALTHLAASKRKQQLRWLRNNKRGRKRLAPALRPCKVCSCSKTRLYREGEEMARHVTRAHGARLAKTFPGSEVGAAAVAAAGTGRKTGAVVEADAVTIDEIDEKKTTTKKQRRRKRQRVGAGGAE